SCGGDARHSAIASCVHAISLGTNGSSPFRILSTNSLAVAASVASPQAFVRNPKHAAGETACAPIQSKSATAAPSSDAVLLAAHSAIISCVQSIALGTND